MKYALKVLEKEAEELIKVLSVWEENKLPVERKLREDKLKSLKKAISYIGI